MIKRKKTFVLTLLLPILVLNFMAVALKTCFVGDGQCAMTCCTKTVCEQGQARFTVPGSCMCQIANNSNTDNQAAILQDVSKPKNKSGAQQFLVETLPLAPIFTESISTRQLDTTANLLSFLNIKIYDLNASYLI